MQRKCTFAVFLLAAALALGACSSDSRTKYRDAPAPAAQASTAGQVALDEASEAQDALTAAQQRTAAARARLEAAGARDDLSTAAGQMALAQAQSALTAALAQEAAALAAFEAAAARAVAMAGTDEERESAQAKAQAARLAGTAPAPGSSGLALRIGDPVAPASEPRASYPATFSTSGADVTWTPRTTSTLSVLSATANPDALDIRDEAVPYADGALFSADGAVSADEFPLRGVATRGDQLGRRPDRSSDSTVNPAVMGSGADAAVWSSYDATYESSIRMRADGSGLALRMGGAGTIFYDMEWLTALGPGATQNQPAGGTCANADNARCDDPTTSDIEAVFGTPTADPDGAAAWHFKLAVPANPATPHIETRDYASLPNWATFEDAAGRTLYRVSDPEGPYQDANGRYRVERAVHGSGDVGAGWQPLEYRRAVRVDRGRPVDQLGIYEVKLSNYAGGAGTETDPREYLRYAAYGLFNYLDFSTREVHYGRFQAFHFGYDAFRDAVGQKPADWGTAANPVTATFTGRTTGWLLQNRHDSPGISNVIRMRGDVSLTANLNAGGGGHGTISGAMRNFEFLNNGVWGRDTNYQLLVQVPPAGTTYPDGDPRIGNAVILKAADIGADGSFSGVAYAAHNSGHDPDGSGPLGTGHATWNFTDGSYGGTFYGPRELGMLEAAGYWRLPAAVPSTAGGTASPGAGTIIGSFGAKSRPND